MFPCLQESIEGILSWRDMKAKEIGLTEVDKRLLMMQKKAQVLGGEKRGNSSCNH